MPTALRPSTTRASGCAARRTSVEIEPLLERHRALERERAVGR